MKILERANYEIGRGPFTKMRTVRPKSSTRVPDDMDEGYFEKDVREMRRLYANRQAVFLDAAEEHLKNFLSPDPSDEGLHLIEYLPGNITTLTIKQSPISCHSTALFLSPFVLQHTAA